MANYVPFSHHPRHVAAEEGEEVAASAAAAAVALEQPAFPSRPFGAGPLGHSSASRRSAQPV